MKKKNIILVTLFFIMVLFGFNDKVYAAKECKSVDCKDEIAEEKAKYENGTNSKLVCSYAVYDNKKEKQYANYIYYDVNKEKFYANSTIGDKDFYGTLKFGTPSFYELRYILGDAQDVLQNFNRCPRYSYIDFKYFNEICFDSDGTSCTYFDGTKNNYESKENSKLVDDLVSQYKDYDDSSCNKLEYYPDFTNMCIYQNLASNRPSYLYLYINSNDTMIHAPNSWDNGYLIKYSDGTTYPVINQGSGLPDYSNIYRNYINVRSCPTVIFNYSAYSVGANAKYYNYYTLENSSEYEETLASSGDGWKPYDLVTNCGDEKKEPVVEPKQDISCDLIDQDIIDMINEVMNYIRIGVPILLLCLIIVDFSSAIFASSEDKMKKAQSKVIKRIIIAIVIFFVPTLLNFVFDIVNDVWEDANYEICGLDK